MTWKSAKHDAKRYVKAMVDLIESRNGSVVGVKINLTDYEDEACYNFLKGLEPEMWSLEYHRMVNRAVQRDLQRMGAKVEIVIIHLDEYWQWLERNNLKDATENRAQFIGEKKQNERNHENID